MDGPELSGLADEALNTFAEIADFAADKLTGTTASPASVLIGGNAFNNGRAFQSVANRAASAQESWQALRQEPSIARLLLEDDDGARRVLYIARRSGQKLQSGRELASYGSPLGRLAELTVGDGREIIVNGQRATYSLIEKITFVPRDADGAWDSIDNLYRHADLGVFSIDSLRALLGRGEIDFSDELEAMLEQSAAQEKVRRGIAHRTRTAMGLRDQPILDQFQGEIFRLPLDSQLILLGPAGTGKTTTLIKRLGQKLNLEDLEDRDRQLVTASSVNLPHAANWQMFTPSDLLKHYLKEAFNREQVPASDQRIKTWSTYRDDIARNVLGILRSTNTGKHMLKRDQDNLSAEVLADPRDWFDAFQAFHEQRLRMQFEDGALLADEAAPSTNKAIAHELMNWASNLGGHATSDIYRDLNGREANIRQVLEESRSATDELLKQERNRIFNPDKQVFNRLAAWLAAQQLKADDDPDEDDELEEEEETIEVTPAGVVDLRNAVKAYEAAIRSLARRRYRKRNLPKGSRAAGIVEWLGERLPTNEVLQEIGQRLNFQSGLRRFVNAFRRYLSDVPASYRAFRRERTTDPRLYREAVANPLNLAPTELDAIVLLMLRNSRALLDQSWVRSDLEAPRFEMLRRVADLFRTQVMVDEATDFSPLQLACMESLTSLQTRSFFACGDFNQRITATGIRSMAQLQWVSPKIRPEKINVVYRQSRRLNEFAGGLLTAQGGDLGALGELPAESTHDGVSPVLLENADHDAAAAWIAARIGEVERAVQTMPTIAVLVNNEAEVRPMAQRLNGHLEALSLKAVPCDEGQSLGAGTDVRVFDVQHIKGLEFEAVFFVGIDQLAEQKPELFDRFLYVGATRAATYLGLVCRANLPAKLNVLRPKFSEHWVI